MDKKNIIDSMLIEHPETIFTEKWLIYTMREIDKIKDQFDRAREPKTYHKDIMALLSATSQFLAATNPESERHQLTNLDPAIQTIFTMMQNALMKARALEENLAPNDAQVVKLAINYAETCIKKRAEEFDRDATLSSSWNRSGLKKILTI